MQLSEAGTSFSDPKHIKLFANLIIVTLLCLQSHNKRLNVWFFFNDILFIAQEISMLYK